MKLNYRMTPLVVALSIASAVHAADTYNLDPAHSTIGFAVTHMVINKVHGRFKEFSGTVVLDGKNMTEAKGVIQVKSVDTGVEMRDKDLRSPNFFDADKYPTITFESKRSEKKGDETILVGDFTMHGVSKEISLPVKVAGPVKDPFGGTRIGLEAKTKINRKDFGMTYNRALEAGGLIVGEEIEIEINAEATKAK